MQFKKRYILILFLAIIIGLICFQMLKRESYNKTYNSLNINLKDGYKLTGNKLEYGDLFDPYSVVEPGVEVKSILENDDFKEVVYTISKTDRFNQRVSKDVNVRFDIIDTTAPVIKLKESEITIEQNQTYDISDNIEKVYDVVDGNLEPEITSNLDTSKPGTYDVVVTAQDKNGLKTVADYQVVVKAVIEPILQKQNIPSLSLGSAGAVKCGSYQAPLEYANLYDNAQRQDVIDSNAAGYSVTGAGIEYIGDHAYQNFNQTIANNTLEIHRNDGTIDTFYKVSSHMAPFDSWIAYDGTDAWTSTEGRLLTQVCVGDDLMFIFWS